MRVTPVNLVNRPESRRTYRLIFSVLSSVDILSFSRSSAWTSLLPFGFQPLLLELGTRSHPEPRPTRRQRSRDVSAVATVLERRDIDRDGVTHLDHVVAVAGAIHVVRAVSFELDVALPLRILHVEDELHVRVDGDELLDDPGDGLAVGEIELNRRMMRGD